MARGADPAAAAAGAPPAWAWTIAAVLVAWRFLFLNGPVDDPHSWRQCDTVYYSLHMARHGLDLLRPQVSWLGSHGALALEFPLPEAIAALLKRAFGPAVLWDRVVSLGFFVLAAAYLHALARRLLGARRAWFATLAYLALPLGIFYSRAAVVDFAAIAFAHAMFFHGLAALRGGGAWHLAATGAFAALGALLKAPALVPVAVALAWAATRSGGRSWLRLAGPLALAAIAFALWRAHVEALNAVAPNWDFIPGYHKIAGRWAWYFGDAAQRLDLGAWWQMLRRVSYEVTTWPGAVLAVAGALDWRRSTPEVQGAPRGVAAAWAVGALAYLLAFWPLNLLHNYYQLPLLAPVALAIGAGLDRLRGGKAVVACAVLLAWCLAASLAIGYFTVDRRLVQAGSEVARDVPAGDLVIAAFPGSRYADPRFLVRADRRGWSLDVTELTPEVVGGLRDAGARWVATVADGDQPQAPVWLDSLRVATRPVPGRREGSIGRLDVYSLERWR